MVGKALCSRRPPRGDFCTAVQGFLSTWLSPSDSLSLRISAVSALYVISIMSLKRGVILPGASLHVLGPCLRISKSVWLELENLHLNQVPQVVLVGGV